MRFTVEEHPRAIERYAHVKPARGWRVASCSARCPGTSRTCTREKGHRGPHVAHRFFNRVAAVWDTGSGASEQGRTAERGRSTRHGRTGGSEPTNAPAKRRRPARKPIGLRARDFGGALEALRKLAARAASSVEEIALLVFFLAFVWFAIDWLLLIMR